MQVQEEINKNNNSHNDDPLFDEYEWRYEQRPHQWMRTHGNEHWEFNDDGLMRIRDMSANDYPIKDSDRKYRS